MSSISGYGVAFFPSCFRFSKILSIEDPCPFFVDERGDAVREYELSYGTQAL